MSVRSAASHHGKTSQSNQNMYTYTASSNRRPHPIHVLSCCATPPHARRRRQWREGGTHKHQSALLGLPAGKRQPSRHPALAGGRRRPALVPRSARSRSRGRSGSSAHGGGRQHAPGPPAAPHGIEPAEAAEPHPHPDADARWEPGLQERGPPWRGERWRGWWQQWQQQQRRPRQCRWQWHAFHRCADCRLVLLVVDAHCGRGDGRRPGEQQRRQQQAADSGGGCWARAGDGERVGRRCYWQQQQP